VLFDTAAGRVVGYVQTQYKNAVQVTKPALLTFDASGEAVFSQMAYAKNTYCLMLAGVRGVVVLDATHGLAAAYNILNKERPELAKRHRPSAKRKR